MIWLASNWNVLFLLRGVFWTLRCLRKAGNCDLDLFHFPDIYSSDTFFRHFQSCFSIPATFLDASSAAISSPNTFSDISLLHFGVLHFSRSNYELHRNVGSSCIGLNAADVTQ